MRDKLKIRYVVLIVFTVCCMGNAAHSNIGRSICTVCISGDFPFLVLLFKTHAFCHRRLVYFPQCTRTSFQSNQGTLYPKEKVETDSAERNGILAVDICMVLSGMGIELLAKELLRTDTHPLYRVHSRNFQKFVDSYIKNLKRFLHTTLHPSINVGVP